MFSPECAGRPIRTNFSDFVLKFNSSNALNETKTIRENDLRLFVYHEGSEFLQHFLEDYYGAV